MVDYKTKFRGACRGKMGTGILLTFSPTSSPRCGKMRSGSLELGSTNKFGKKKIGWEILFRLKLDWKGTRDRAGVPMRG